jgi:adenylate kinase family enzyme
MRFAKLAERLPLARQEVLAHISGPSGSGKTTLAEKLAKKYPGIIFKDLDELDEEAVEQLGWGKIRKRNFSDQMLKSLADRRQKLMDEFILGSSRPIVFVGIHTEGPYVLNIPTKNRFLLDVDAEESAYRAYKRSQNEEPQYRRTLAELPGDITEAQKDIDFLLGHGYKPMSLGEISQWIDQYSKS